jgi:hypothetical protein
MEEIIYTESNFGGPDDAPNALNRLQSYDVTDKALLNFESRARK